VIFGMLAHQGGWDEALLVAVPMLAVFGLLRLAKRRADAIKARRELQTTGSVDVGPEALQSSD
jgi:hypothetical protein